MAIVDSHYISSPDNKITINFIVINNSQGGGLCDSEDTIREIAFSEKLEKYPYARFVAFTSGKNFNIGIQKNIKEIESIKVGDNICNFNYQNSIHSVQTDISDYLSTELIMNVKLNDYANGKISSIDDFDQAIKTDNFKTARKIVESLFVNK